MGYFNKNCGMGRRGRMFDTNEWGTNIKCLYCPSHVMFFEYGRKGYVHLTCDRCGAEGPQEFYKDENNCVNDYKLIMDNYNPNLDAGQPLESKTPAAGTNLKVNRARSMASKLCEGLDEDLREQIYMQLVERLTTNGIAWTTEEERLAFGFEERDYQGWTPKQLEENKTKRKSRVSYDYI